MAPCQGCHIELSLSGRGANVLVVDVVRTVRLATAKSTMFFMNVKSSAASTK
jgi:hypothetical protein